MTLNSLLGESELQPFLETLSAPKKKLLTLYILRQRQQLWPNKGCKEAVKYQIFHCIEILCSKMILCKINNCDIIRPLVSKQINKMLTTILLLNMPGSIGLGIEKLPQHWRDCRGPMWTLCPMVGSSERCFTAEQLIPDHWKLIIFLIPEISERMSGYKLGLMVPLLWLPVCVRSVYLEFQKYLKTLSQAILCSSTKEEKSG